MFDEKSVLDSMRWSTEPGTGGAPIVIVDIYVGGRQWSYAHQPTPEEIATKRPEDWWFLIEQMRSIVLKTLVRS